ncbi:cytochrome c [Vibrio harveyi]|uniref:cytochrome c n=1 Tax=Vibrio harveyi TaxID=669 RepID=UPI00237EF1B6|nr:cytochrome c [Vibrio harveyi]
MRKFFFSVVFLLLVSSFGFAGYKWFTDNQYGEADLVAGKQRFESYCVSCHGDKGHGDGLVARAMDIKPDYV